MAEDTSAATNEPILLREDNGGVCTLTLNRPAEFNALSEAMLDSLQASFDAIAEDASVRVICRVICQTVICHVVNHHATFVADL